MSTLARPSLGRSEIERIRGVVGPYVRRTPVVRVAGEDLGLSAGEVVLKLELLQRSGSFKARGAFLSLLVREIGRDGVVAASGGNHGAAVAYAAGVLDVPARIFVPGVSSPAKVERIRRCGADLVIHGDDYADALAASQRWLAESDAVAVHAFDQPETILGQGTVGAEIEEQAPELDTLLVPVGGGGLIAGIAAWYSGAVRVIAVEPEDAPTLTAALDAGKPVDAPVGSIAVDCLAPRRVGELVFPIVRTHVAGAVLVSDTAILDAQRLLWDQVRVLAEPGGAAGLAALVSGSYRPAAGERVGIVISGGNTDRPPGG